MSELVMMEAALFQLRAALDEDPALLPVRLSADVLGQAIAGARANGINTARVNDIEFALHDLVEAVDDAGAPDSVCAAIALLQNDAAALRAQTMLPKELTQAIRALQTKLRARAKAMDRSQYRAEGMAAEPLPHPPDELRQEAIPIVRQLAAAGFETPALDVLVADPDVLRFHTINEIVDELEIVLGG
jgi:hypothetical protein